MTAETRPRSFERRHGHQRRSDGLPHKGGKLVSEKQKLTLIPYYAWAHRGRGEMEVWLAREPKLARPVPEPTLASMAKAGASGGKGVDAINDLFEPENSNDHAAGYLHWWPKKGTVEWVQYDFRGPMTVSETSVYWFDDTGVGECRVPGSWKALYKAGNKWVPGEEPRPVRRGKRQIQHGSLRARAHCRAAARDPAAGEVLGGHPGMEGEVKRLGRRTRL